MNIFLLNRITKKLWAWELLVISILILILLSCFRIL